MPADMVATKHIKHYLTCSEPVITKDPCGNRTWELCDKCDGPVCGVHIVKHYRRFHREML